MPFYECDVYLIVQDWNTGLSKGYGFVQFKENDAAIEALRASHEIAGSKVTFLLSDSGAVLRYDNVRCL